MNNALRWSLRAVGPAGFFLLMLVTLAAWAQAQPAVGTLKVKVVDEAGNPCPRAYTCATWRDSTS